MKYEILEDFEVPKLPFFRKGDVRKIKKDLGKVLEQRGLVKEIKEEKKTEKLSNKIK